MICHDCGHRQDVFETIENAPHAPRACPSCHRTALVQDWQSKNVECGAVDGPTSGYYGRDTGWPPDPTNPLKVICPGKQAWKDHILKSKDTPNPLRDLT